MIDDCASPTVVVGAASWVPTTFAVADVKNPVRVAEANPRRRAVLVVNLTSSAGTVYLSDRTVAGAGAGARSFPLAPGEGVTVNTYADVWAHADPGNLAATVKVIEEIDSA